MNLGVLYSPFDKLANKEVENDLFEMGHSVKSVLESAGFTPKLLDIDKVGFHGIQSLDLDMLFNVCERLNGDGSYEPHIASVLELMGVPITGSSGLTLSVCNNKVATKALAKDHRLPTPSSLIFNSVDDLPSSSLEFPVIVKPSAMHNSIGIYKDSIARNADEMQEKAKRIITQYSQSAIAEEFILGKDVEVTIIGNKNSAKVLPLVEVHYPNLANPHEQFFSYESKWSKNSVESGVYRAASGLSENQEQKIISLAKRCYRLFELRDYGRMDFRIGIDGSISLLEVTANPGLSPGDSTSVAATLSGMSHSNFILEIFLAAAQRNSLLSRTEAHKVLAECALQNG